MLDKIIHHYLLHFDRFTHACKARILKNPASNLSKIKNGLDETPSARYIKDASKCRCGGMADASDLKSDGTVVPCGFESHQRYFR